MTAWRCDPYLWIHLSGLATVPFWLILCLFGFGVGYPTLPGLELALVVAAGALPILYMQIRRPFCVFSLLLLALKPSVLTDDQQRLLALFRSPRVRWIAPAVTLALVWCLYQLYQVAPVVYDVNPVGGWNRAEGLALATVGFWGANLFLQVPCSVAQVLATPNIHFKQVGPYPPEAVNRDFCHFGLPVGRILPSVVPVDSGVMNEPEASHQFRPVLEEDAPSASPGLVDNPDPPTADVPHGQADRLSSKPQGVKSEGIPSL